MDTRFLSLGRVVATPAASEALTNRNTHPLTALTGWPVERFLGPEISYTTWFNALGVLVAGMMGGFLSGLLYSRSSRVTLADYQETMLKLALRPMVGGIIALALVVMLSWNLIPAIDPKNAGVFLLAAFLSGFSERYFLKLLDIQEDGEGGYKTPTVDKPESPRVATAR
jgi:hypothetical protein